jgi:hypothetical protein
MTMVEMMMVEYLMTTTMLIRPNTDTHTHTHTHTHTYTHTHTHTHTLTHTHTHTHTHSHTHIHTYTYTHTHTHNLFKRASVQATLMSCALQTINALFSSTYVAQL